MPRQNSEDDASCGVIAAEEIIKRIQNIDLTLDNSYPVGAEQLRISQLQYLEEKLGQGDRVFQLFRKEVISQFRWEIYPYDTEEKSEIDKLKYPLQQRQTRDSYIEEESYSKPDQSDSKHWSIASKIRTEINTGKDIIHKITQQEHSDSATIVIGRTGSGKSTLVNYLVMPERITVEKNKYDMVKVNGGVAEVGDGTVAHTTVPNKVGEYWDCPGFDDNRHEGQDIVNAFYIREVFALPKLAKLMLVIQWDELKGSVRIIKKLMKTLGGLFNNIDDILPALSIVVSKVPQNKTKLVQLHIERLLEGLDSQEDLYAKRILESCIKTGLIPLLVFTEIEPTNNPQPIVDLIGSNQEILSSLAERKYVSIPKVNISVAAESQVFVDKLVIELSNNIYRDINYLVGKHKEFVSKLCDVKKGLPELSHLMVRLKEVTEYQNEIKVLVDKLNQLNPSEDVNSLIVTKRALKTIEEYPTQFDIDISEECSRLISLIEQFEFFIQIKPDTIKIFDYALVKPVFQGIENAVKKEIELFVGRLSTPIYDKSQKILEHFVS